MRFLTKGLGFVLTAMYRDDDGPVEHAEARWSDGGGVMFGLSPSIRAAGSSVDVEIASARRPGSTGARSGGDVIVARPGSHRTLIAPRDRLRASHPAEREGTSLVDWTLEVVILPVRDIDALIAFYRDKVRASILTTTRRLTTCT